MNLDLGPVRSFFLMYKMADPRCKIKPDAQDRVSFGKDHQGNSVVIKRVFTASPLYIDTHCRFDHPNLSHGSVLVPNICKIDHIILLLEPALYSLKDFIKFQFKNEDYFATAENYARDLVRGLSLLHKSGLAHNKIHPGHCLIKLDACCLTDFKYVSLSNKDSIKSDNKNLGKTFVEMFTFSESGNVADYIAKFNKMMPYQDLLFGRSYLIEESKSFEIDDVLGPVVPSFKTIFCEVVRKIQSGDSLEFVFSCLHNLHRAARNGDKLLTVTADNVIKFTEYAFGIDTDTDTVSSPDTMNYIFVFSGKLLPTTVYDTARNFEEVVSFGQKIFKENYLDQKIISRPIRKNLKFSDIENTKLAEMFSEPEKFLS